MAQRDRTGCPRPDKLAYDIGIQAEYQRALGHVGRDGNTNLYLCRCGWWHLGRGLG